MDTLIKNDEIKISILKYLQQKGMLTPSRLSHHIRCKYETANKSLIFFEKIGLVEKEAVRHGQKVYSYYKLTKLGQIISRNLK